MAQTMKEQEQKAVATRRPSEILARSNAIERLFERMVEDIWRPPFSNLLRPERWRVGDGGILSQIPAVDVYEDKDEVVVKAEIPGLAKEDITVQVMDSTLTIKGEKKREEEIKENEYYCCERSFGTFTRTVELPWEVKADQVKASFKSGVLHIRMPKTEEAKRKAVTVKID